MSRALLKPCLPGQSMVALCKDAFTDEVWGVSPSVFSVREDLRLRVSHWVPTHELPREYDLHFPESYSWISESEPKLLNHLIDGHIDMIPRRPYEGVPRYDLEILKSRGFSAQSLVPAIFQRLQRSDEDIRRDFFLRECVHPGDPRGTYSPQDYRTILIRTLRYMQDLDIADIPWKSACDVYPGADLISVDPQIHARDKAFLMVAARI